MLGIDVEAIALRIALGLDDDESLGDYSPVREVKTDMQLTSNKHKTGKPTNSKAVAQALSPSFAQNTKEIDNFTQNKLILDGLLFDGCSKTRKASFATDNCP